MRRIAHPAGIALVLFVLCLAESAAAGEGPAYAKPVKPVPPVVHGYCYADARGDTVYFSVAFSSAPVGGPGGDTLQETTRRLGNTVVAWRSAFESYLMQEHETAGLIQCAMEESVDKARASRQALLDMFRRNNASHTRKRTFVETDWAYSDSTSPP